MNRTRRITLGSVAALAIAAAAAGWLLCAGCGAWTVQESGTWQILHDVWGSGPGRVYAVGDEGTILCTTDGGRTWTPRAAPTRAKLHAVWGTSPDDVYVGGDEGTVLHTTDGGASWTVQRIDDLFRVNAIWGRSGDEVYLATATGVFCSTDRGVTWERRSEAVFEAIAGTPDGLLLGCGWNVARSTDGGRTWTEPPPLGGGAADLVVAGPSVLYAAMGSSVGRSTDGGVTWRTSPSLTRSQGSYLFAPERSDQLAAVWAASEDAAFAVGERGTIVETTDGGATWDLLPASTDHTLTAIWGSGPGDVYAVGTGGTILHSR